MSSTTIPAAVPAPVGPDPTAQVDQDFSSCPLLARVLAEDESLEKDPSLDDLSKQLRREAIETAQTEPALRGLLSQTVLAPGVRTFEDAVATTVTYRLLLRPCHTKPSSAAVMMTPPSMESFNTSVPSTTTPPPAFCPYSLRGIIAQALSSDTHDIQEAGHTLREAVRRDAVVVVERDPAVDTLLEVVLFLKGFAALVCHRAAYYQWHQARRRLRANRKSMVALWLQSQASAVFGLDIHPAATLGAGLLLDHGTGIVIGETATVGDGCTLLHGVTLGGTGKNAGVDRHPKVGRDVLIGAQASLLGNIRIGDGAKIGAGSVVLRPIPAHATAVGAPAQIVGRAREAKPAAAMDETLQQVHQIHASSSVSTLATAVSSGNSTTSSSGVENGGTGAGVMTDHTPPPVASVEANTRPATDLAYAASEDEGESEEKEEEESCSDDTTPPETTAPTTDNGPTIPKKQHLPKRPPVDVTGTDLLCPFQQYTRLAALAPPTGITIATLRYLLEPYGVPVSKIGEILFALDHRDVGYIKPKDLLTADARHLLVEKTDLSADTVDDLLQGLEAKVARSTRRRTQSVRSSRVEPVPRDIPLTTSAG